VTTHEIANIKPELNHDLIEIKPKLQEVKLIKELQFSNRIKEALKTVRHLPLFGKLKHELNFQWPSPTQLAEMAHLDPNLHLTHMHWQGYRPNLLGLAIYSIGITLSNGKKSPMFSGIETDLSPINTAGASSS